MTDPAPLPALPEPPAYYWTPKAESGISPGLATWSSNTGPHPSWDVQPFYTADQMHAYARAAIAAQTATVTGGSPEHLLQDQDRGLSQWLANQPDARLRVRERCAEIAVAQTAPDAPDIPPGWESAYAIGDLLLAVTRWKATTPRNARPAFDDLVKACAALVAAAHAQQPAPLTDAQKARMYQAAAKTFWSGTMPAYLAGVTDAERAHGIPAPTTDTGEQR